MVQMMMVLTTINRSLLVLLLCLISPIIWGQTGTQVVLKVMPQLHFEPNPKANVFILGESHFERNNNHKVDIIRELIKAKHLKRIGIEAPLAEQNIYNNYLHKNDNSSLQLLNYGSKFQTKQTILLLNEIRKINSELDSADRISIFCFDVPYPLDIRRTFIDLSYLFKERPGIKNLLIGRYILKKEKKVSESRSVIITDSLWRDLKANREVYLSVLKDSFSLYEKILKGMRVCFSKEYFLSQKTLENRERFIYDNVIESVKAGEPLLIFCGNDHANKNPEDNYYDSFKFTSFTSRLKKEFGEKIMAITTEYYKPKIKQLIFREPNMLDVKFSDLFKDGQAYLYFDERSLVNQPVANKRCDMLIIKNCKIHSDK